VPIAAVSGAVCGADRIAEARQAHREGFEMTARLRRMTAITVAAGCTLALAATAVGARQISTPLPSLASMAIAVSDFQSGAAIVQQSTTTSDGQPVFTRRFGSGARIGGVPYVTAVDEVALYPDAASSAHDFAVTQDLLARKSGRTAFATTFAKGMAAGSKGRLKITKTITSPPVVLDAGSLSLAMTVVTNQGKLPIAVDVVQADRAFSVIFLAGMFGQRIGHGDAAHLAAAAEAHIKAAFTVSSTAAPTISGQAQQGQTLTVDEGSWIGAPSSFGYVWARCDSTGATCTPIDGATDKTYTLTSADSGFTVRVTVTGANTVSSQQAVSVPTATVS
jgi:hypothetical protein